MNDGKLDPEFGSVSHKATVKLMKSKGYRLIGSHRYGFNLILLRNDIGQDVFPEAGFEQTTIRHIPSIGKRSGIKWLTSLG